MNAECSCIIACVTKPHLCTCAVHSLDTFPSGFTEKNRVIETFLPIFPFHHMFQLVVIFPSNYLLKNFSFYIRQ